MPSKPSCCTAPSCRTSGDTARAPRSPGPAGLIGRLVDQALRAGRDPRVEPPLGHRDGELLAMRGQDPRVALQRQHAAADRAELAGKVLELALVRNRPAAANAAATCLACPCVQITASTSRWPTTFMTASADSPGSMTITSSSSPTIQVLTVPATRSILACICPAFPLTVA